jgi:hypothetical protein
MPATRRVTEAATAKIAYEPVCAANLAEELPSLSRRQFVVWEKLELMQR